MRFRFLALLGAALLVAAPAVAKFVRFPASGAPAWEVHVPEDWSVTKGKNENLMAFSPNTKVRVVVQVLPSSGSLDDFATTAMSVGHAAAWSRKRPIAISGYKGFDYFSSMSNAAGNHFNLEMIIVRVDAGHVGVLDLLTDVGVPKGEMAVGRQVVGAMKIVR